MDNYSFIWFLLSSFVTISLIFDFSKRLFEPQYSRKFIKAIEILTIFILAIINSFEMPFLNLITSVSVSLCVAIFLYKSKSLFHSIMYSLFIWLLFIISETICGVIVILLANIAGVQTFSIFAIYVVPQFFLIVFYYTILIRFFSKVSLIPISRRNYYYFLTYTTFNVFLIITIAYCLFGSVNTIQMMLTSIVLIGTFVININLIPFLEVISKKERLEYENIALQEREHASFIQYENLRKNHEVSSQLIHDVKKHVNVLEQLYESNNYIKAKEYGIEFKKSLDQNKIHIFTTNEILNILLNEKDKFAKENQIDFSISLGDISFEGVNDVDLTTIFANLLDNAFESAMLRNEDRYVFISSKQFGQIIALSITNSYDGPDVSKIHELKSSKGNRKGLGIPNVLRVVEKYNGDLSIKGKNGCFSCTLTLADEVEE